MVRTVDLPPEYDYKVHQESTIQKDHDLLKCSYETVESVSSGGDPRFHQLLKEMGELHSKKSADYGQAQDPFANVRAAREFGIPPWLGAVLRMNDKVTRIKSFAQKGKLENESLEDSLLDIAVYSMIALILYREESGKNESNGE